MSIALYVGIGVLVMVVLGVVGAIAIAKQERDIRSHKSH